MNSTKHYLKSLEIYFSTHWGSSRGLNKFIANNLKKWKKANPQYEVKVFALKHKHPFIRANYLQGRLLPSGVREPTVRSVRNYTPEQIEDILDFLKNRDGKKAKKVNTIYSETPSIQGFWHPWLGLQRETDQKIKIA
eukprot:TRINITY_DN203_c0_g4_i1.p1 TRINITY_DN203_c0_g4~~TRINITY_DN203_c0_g4_i1.p1  ORF type:complete len:137 (-),score=39.01 TRINITY_DN203_c0_g4_i1:218-628(-)